MLTRSRRSAAIFALAAVALAFRIDTRGPAEPAPSPLQKDAEAFAAESAKLTPAQAAERWLALLDRAMAADDELARARRQWWFDEPGENTAVVMRALPPPPSW